MEWFRRNPKVTALAGAVVLGLSLLLVWFFVRGGDPVEPPATLGTPLPSSTLSPLPTPTGTPSTSVEQTFQQAMAGRAAGKGSLALPGLPGGSYSKTLPRHRLTLLAHSARPIGTVGYIVPTSVEAYSGIKKHVGRSWRLRTTVYGSPDYAQIYLQAGWPGYPITCEIWVDGKLREKKSTEGPYGQLLCQG